LGYRDGLLLQLFNPKVFLYGLTIYATFLAPITSNLILLFISAVFLASVAFCSTSSWAISGATLKHFLRDDRTQRIVNTILALLLVYTAIDLSGVLGLLS